MAEYVRLIGQRQRDYAKRLIDQSSSDDAMRIGKETRRDAQNRKLHAMIADIRDQVPDMATFSVEDAKLRFMDCLGAEMRYLPKLEGQGFFPVGHRTSTLTVKQFNGLIELLYKYGAENGVIWSEPDLRDAA